MGASRFLEILATMLASYLSRLLGLFAEQHGRTEVYGGGYAEQKDKGVLEGEGCTDQASRIVSKHGERVYEDRLVYAEHGEDVFLDAEDGELSLTPKVETVGATGTRKLFFEDNDAAYNKHLRKEEFFSSYEDQYGYSNSDMSVEKLRSLEFSHLKGDVYLDHAGATLYSSSQIRSSVGDLCKNLYGNPHSQSGCSNISANMVASSREEVLKFFNVTSAEYKCVFTAGATAALKLVGECFPWTNKSRFWYTMENHNSVLGIREYALAAGASACAVEVEGFGEEQSFKFKTFQSRRGSFVDKLEEGVTFSLFAFPLECNFSGRKFDLNSIKSVRVGALTKDSANRCMVLLDAAKGCATSRLDLSKHPADFVAVSFYKIFGYPTGLGALLVRKESSRVLKKRYFGGGTVAVSVADVDFVKMRESIEQSLEDGTVSFLGIASLHSGFSMVNKLGMSNIERHVGSLAKFTASQLSGLKHKNGSNVCVVYGNHGSVCYWGDYCSQGPIVAFNLKRFDGTWVGYREVEELATLNGIHLRTGCFCNPGACSKYLELSESEIRANHEAGHVCWDDHDIIDGKPAGAIRISFGYMSTIEDSLAFIDFICKYFVTNCDTDSDSRVNQLSMRDLVSLSTNDIRKSDCNMTLESITIYPIKSCGGFTVDSWSLGNSGLLYDREWVVMSSAGFVLTQKKCPMMCLIGTYIEQSTNTLRITSPNMQTRLEVPLVSASHQEGIVRFDLCGEGSTGSLYGKGVADWFTKALGASCTLVKKQPRSRHLRLRGATCESQACKDARELSYANEGQFLLVSRASVDDLNRRAISATQRLQFKQKKKTHLSSAMQVDVMRFRPNFVVCGGSAFEEDNWKSLTIGGQKFLVLGGCNRCQMVNIDQSTGKSQEGSNPLLTLASYRRSKGKILFGLLLVHNPSQHDELEEPDRNEVRYLSEKIIKAGCKLHVERDSTA